MRFGRTLVVLIILGVWAWCASGDNVAHHRTGNANAAGLSATEQETFWAVPENGSPTHATGMTPGSARFTMVNGFAVPIQ